MNTSIFGRFRQSQPYEYLQIAAFALIGFFAGFFLPLRLSVPLRYEFALPLVITFFLLWAAWRLPHPWDEAFSAAVIMMIFSAVLAALWRTGTHGIYETFGLLPWFDAEGYYSEALRLLDGGIFTQISARRPIFPAFFSSLLLITGRNLRLSLAIMTFLAGISTWLLTREIKLSENNAFIPSGIAVFLVFYYRKFNGAVLTDPLGFSLGVLGLALLWNSISNKRLIPALVGLFCITVGESARPGAVFTLPILFLWIVFCLKTDTGYLKKAFTAGLVIVFGLLTNIILTKILAPETSSSYSNFANLIYALVNGGIGWHAVYDQHPEFFVSGNEGFAAQQIYLLSWQIFIHNPEKALLASLRAIQAFFSATPNSAFNYLDSVTTVRDLTFQNSPLEFLSRWGANILLILLFPISIIARKNERLTLLLALNLGVIVSLPFAAPWDVENMRAYAVSIPGLVMGTFYVLLYLFKKGKMATPLRTAAPKTAYAITVALFLLFFIAPLTIHLIAKAPSPPSGQCPAGKETFITRVSSNSTISIGKNPSDPLSISYSRFQKELDQFPDAVVGQRLKTIPENSIISQQNDALHGNMSYWLVGPMEIIQENNTLSTYCGKWSSDSRTRFIFFAESRLP